MKNILRKELKRQAGQGMSEYIIIVALIAVAAIGIVTLFGDEVRDLFGASAEALTGEDEASRNAGPLNENVAEHKNLNDFSKNMEGKENGLK